MVQDCAPKMDQEVSIGQRTASHEEQEEYLPSLEKSPGSGHEHETPSTFAKTPADADSGECHHVSMAVECLLDGRV
jgi:hypothetical protein